MITKWQYPALIVAVLVESVFAAPFSIGKVNSQEFFSNNPESHNLMTSQEALWAAKGGDGTRGGGDTRLESIRENREALIASRQVFLNRFQEVDWPTIPNEEIRNLLLKTLLPANPVEQISRLRIYFTESCRSNAGDQKILLVPDAGILCLNASVDPEVYSQIWPEVLALTVGRPELSAVLNNLSAVSGESRSVVSIQALLAQLYHVSLPVAQSNLPSSVTHSNFSSCRIPLDLEELSLSAISGKLDRSTFRHHPEGHWIARIQGDARYVKCQ